jgi:hypothetical protein
LGGAGGRRAASPEGAEAGLGGAFRAFGVNERKRFQDDFEFGYFLMGVFVFPGVQFEPALDQNGPAFAHVLGDDFSLATPGVNVHKGDFLLALAGFAFPGAVDRQAQFGDSHALWGVAQFGVAGQVAGEDDFVEIGHRAAGRGRKG